MAGDKDDDKDTDLGPGGVTIESGIDLDSDEMVAVDLSDLPPAKDDKAGDGSKGEKEGDSRARDDNADVGTRRRDNETREEKRERRRREEKESRARRNEFTQRDQRLIRELSDVVQRQSEVLRNVTGKLTAMEVSEAVGARDYWLQQEALFKRHRAKALEEGRGDDFTRYDDKANDARARAVKFNSDVAAHEAAVEKEQTEPQRPPAGTVDATEVARVTENNKAFFRNKFAWFDPAGEDEASELVRQLDAKVHKSGLRPDNAAYWQQLEALMAEEGLDEDGFVDDDDDRPAKREPRRERTAPAPARDRDGRFRRGPPVSGRTEGASGAPLIPKALKQQMIEAGLWDDPVKRKAVIDDYEKNHAKKKA